MKYVKPICECGDFLVMREEEVYTVRHAIKTNGKKTKRQLGIKQFECTNVEDLECPSCSNEYEVNLDNFGRIIRGDLKCTLGVDNVWY
ncbi:hypothetical protein AB9M90_10490 [Bacillus safensis]|uniref:hypothetical protein n=1 Tax=Bacillus safensis TaxID=561879 RepID=UPI00351602A2